MDIQSAPDKETAEDEEGLQPGEVEVEVNDDGPEDDEAEAKPEEAQPQEERKTRRERREEHERKRISDQVREQLAVESARMRQEFEQRYRPPEPKPEPKPEADDDSKVVRELRKEGAYKLRLIKDPDSTEEEVRELTAQYQEIQEKIVGEIVKRNTPKTEQQADHLAVLLQSDFPEFYANPALLEVARKRGAIIAQQNPGLHPFAIARQSFLDVKGAIEKQRAQRPSPEQASKYGSPTSAGGPRESTNNGTTVRLTGTQRKLALSTYRDRLDWSDEKKLETWAKQQKKMGLL